MTPNRKIPWPAVRWLAVTVLVLLGALSALPARADLPPWQLAPDAPSHHFVDRPNRGAERRSLGIISYVSPQPARANGSQAIPLRPEANRRIQQTSYQLQETPTEVSGEMIFEGEGPVLQGEEVVYGEQAPGQYAQEGSVVYEDGAQMMGGPGGFVSQRRAREDYWNSPASDQGYPCYPVWLPLRDHLYVRGEYLLWWAKGSSLAPLANVTNGATGMNNSMRSGARLTFGYWFDLCHWRAFEVTYLTLDTQADRYVDGTTTIDATTDFKGLGTLFRRALIANGCNRFDMLLGYRGLELQDDLRGSTAAAGEVAHIYTRNRFRGFGLGFGGEVRRNCWTLDAQMMLAMGNANSFVSINNTSYKFDNFAVVPELGVTVGYDVTSRLRATAGYTFLYWSMLARAGDQLDQVGSAQFLLSTTDYWTQGLNFGAEWQF